MLELRSEKASFYFFPMIGFRRYMRQSLNQKGDFLYKVKHYREQYPGKSYEITNLGSNAVIMLRDHRYTKEFLSKPGLYEKHVLFRILKVIAKDSLPLAEGDIWKKHRKIITSCFHYAVIANNIEVVRQVVTEYLDKISFENEFPVVAKMQEITGEIIGRIFFGRKMIDYRFKGNSLAVALAKLATQLGLLAVSPAVFLFGPDVLKVPFVQKYKKLLNNIKEFKELCLSIVRDRKAHPQGSHDLLDALIKTQNLGSVDDRLSDEEIVNEFIAFFFAGTDNTSHVASMMLYNLTQYPEYLEFLGKERDETYNTEEKKTAGVLQKMDLLNSFTKETMRFYNPAPGITFRVATEDHKLLDLDIKKGDILRGDLFAPYFDEGNFKNPHEFNPMRFLDPNFKLEPCAFTPFSAGPRNCIGQYLAIFKLKIIISEFLERFNFKLQDGYQLRMTWKFTYEPVDPLVLELSRKESLCK